MRLKGSTGQVQVDCCRLIGYGLRVGKFPPMEESEIFASRLITNLYWSLDRCRTETKSLLVAVAGSITGQQVHAIMDGTGRGQAGPWMNAAKRGGSFTGRH